MEQKKFLTIVFGFTLGILLSSFIKLGFSFFLFLLLISFFIFIWNIFLFGRNKIIFLIILFLFSFGLGILRYEIKDIRPVDLNLEKSIGQKVIIKGIIMAEPAIKDQSVQLTVRNEKGSKVLVSTGLFPEFTYGDLIQVEGKIEKPDSFETETGKIFDYTGFLAKDDIFYQISFAEVKIISSGHGSFIKTKLFAFKNAFIKKINILIKEPESALLNGLLLGAKNSLGKDLQEDFRLAGVSHIVALSGYNITIVAVGIMAVLSFLPQLWAIVFGGLGIIFFAIMTGGSATIVRASIMATLVLIARSTNRKYDIVRALLLAGVFMLIQNPKILVFDISFQLSFLSTLALILISPLLTERMSFLPEKYHFRELIVATVATQIFVLPFLIYRMGLISVYGLFANVLILPFIPLIMLFGFSSGVLAFISHILAWPLAFISSLLLSYVLKVITFFAHLPFASFGLENFPLTLTILIYLIFTFFIWRKQKSHETFQY